MRNVILILTLLVAVSCTQHVTLNPMPADPCSDIAIEDVDRLHREHVRGFDGSCVGWVLFMEEQLASPCTLSIMTADSTHMVMGFYHESGLYISDINRAGLVHINNAGLAGCRVWTWQGWKDAEIITR